MCVCVCVCVCETHTHLLWCSPDFLPFLAAEPVSEVAIRSDVPEATEHNSTVVLNCSAKGSFLRFTWTNGTKPLVSDDKRITLKEVGPAWPAVPKPPRPRQQPRALGPIRTRMLLTFDCVSDRRGGANKPMAGCSTSRPSARSGWFLLLVSDVHVVLLVDRRS